MKVLNKQQQDRNELGISIIYFTPPTACINCYEQRQSQIHDWLKWREIKAVRDDDRDYVMTKKNFITISSTTEYNHAFILFLAVFYSQSLWNIQTLTLCPLQ